MVSETFCTIEFMAEWSQNFLTPKSSWQNGSRETFSNQSPRRMGPKNFQHQIVHGRMGHWNFLEPSEFMAEWAQKLLCLKEFMAE
jgi:hypothetical protein